MFFFFFSELQDTKWAWRRERFPETKFGIYDVDEMNIIYDPMKDKSLLVL